MQPASLPALRIDGLTKTYRLGLTGRVTRQALHPLDLEVRRGEIFGYLGPNGSGKTTTLKVLMGLVRADAGTVEVLGLPLADPAWRRRAGYLPEHPYFYDYLTPAEYLGYAGRLLGLETGLMAARSEELLRLVGLSDSRDVPMRRFSKGMVQRLGLAQALLNDPEIVFLDEPMSGLDPIGRHMVRNIILGLRERGKTVFFSTHILPDAETLCDRLALLRAGRLLKVGRLDEILAIDISHFEVLCTGGGAAAREAAAAAGAGAAREMGERWRVEIGEPALPALVSAVAAAGARVLGVQPVRESLEEYFFREMGGDTARDPWTLAD